jgi:hypothetical protein
MIFFTCYSLWFPQNLTKTNVDCAFVEESEKWGLLYAAYPFHGDLGWDRSNATWKPQSIIGHSAREDRNGLQWSEEGGGGAVGYYVSNLIVELGEPPFPKHPKGK